MNKVFLIGHLVKDPELRYTSSNIPVASFTLAVNRNFTNQNGEKETDFINIVAWKKQAENIHKYCFKGSKVAIDGRLQTRSYEDQTGQKRYVTEVVSENIEFLSAKKEETKEKSNSEILKDVMTDKDPFEEFAKETQISNSDLPFLGGRHENRYI